MAEPPAQQRRGRVDGQAWRLPVHNSINDTDRPWPWLSPKESMRKRKGGKKEKLKRVNREQDRQIHAKTLTSL